MTDRVFDVAEFDDRLYFEKALRHGVAQHILTKEKLQTINSEAPKGIVQIATAFGSPYLRDEIELARSRIVNLVSLYLFETSDGDLDHAARLIRDNTFLTLSRGGSTLLKELFALPEYAILGPYDNGRVEDFLEYWSRKKTSKDYRDARQDRHRNQLEIRLAKKLGIANGLSAATFQEQHCEAAALIRSVILMRLEKIGPRSKPTPGFIDQVGYVELLEKIRKKGSANAANLAGEFSEEEQAIIAATEKDIVLHDLPKIRDDNLPLDQLIAQIRDRYFIRDSDMEDTASYDALVSKEWSKHTKGKTDIDAIFTLLLCLSAKLPGKTSLSENGAKTLIKKVRSDGFHAELGSLFVKHHAPHEKQEGLLEDWEEFCEQAELYLLDDWDHDLHIALKFLHENCYIEKAVRKAK